MKGWHEWLFDGRLAEAQGRIALLNGRPVEAVESAERALELATSKGRRKYVCRSLVTMGQGLLALDRVAEAQIAMRRAVHEAERLGHAPSLWTASRALAVALDRSGLDEDAEAARTVADGAIAAVASGLSEEHRATFLQAQSG